MKKAFLILQYSILKSTVVQYNSWHTDAGSSAQARRATNWRRERRGEMVALKDHQQRRQRASCNFTHAWCWWHRFCFLAGFSSVLSCSWSGTSVMSSSLQLYGLYPASLLCSWDFPTKNLGVVVMPSSRGSSWLKDWTLPVFPALQADSLPLSHERSLQFYPPSCKNNPVMSGSCPLFLIADGMVALDCIMNACCNLPISSYVLVLCLLK